MAQGESQMVSKLAAWLVSFVEYAPALFLSPTTSNKFLRNTAWLLNGCLQAECLDERRPTGKLRSLWNGLLLETDWRFKFKAHLSKSLSL